MRSLIGVGAISMMLLGCESKPTFTADELEGLAFEGGGDLAGFSLGESWEQVKAKRDATRWPEVVDEPGRHQLRSDRDLKGNSAPLYLSFHFEPDGKAASFNITAASAGGDLEGAKAVLEFTRRATARYEAAYGAPTCAAYRCTWKSDGARPTFEVLSRLHDGGSAEGSVRVVTPEASK